jgi:hypothetical protein
MDKERKNPETEEELPGLPDEDLGDELPEDELPPPDYPADDEDFDEASSVERRWDKKKRGRGLRNRLRPLIWSIVSVAVLAVGYLGVQLLFPPEEAPVVDKSVDYTYLVNYDPRDIATMEFEFRDGYSYTLNMTRSLASSGYTVTSYAVEGKYEYEYNSTAFDSLLSATSRLTSATEVVEAPDDLSLYGLENPAVRVTYTDNDGEQSVVLLGDATPVGSGHYAMREDGDMLYVIGNYNSGYMLNTDLYYRKLALTEFTEYYMTEIDDVTLVNDGVELYVHRSTTEEKEEFGLFATTFRILEPVDAGVNDYYLDGYVYSKVAALTATKVLVDRPDDLSVYGLATEDSPDMVRIKAADGNVKTLYIGAAAEDGSGVYVRVNGVTSVYLFPAETFDFLSIRYQDIMDYAIWTYMLDTVDSVEMNLAGEEHTLKFANMDEEGNVDAWLDDEVITGENGKMLYTRVLQIYSNEVIPEGEEPGGDVAYSFRIIFNDGSPDATLEFHPLGDRRFAIIRNGEDIGLYSRVTAFQAILDGIRDVKIGYNIGHVIS